MAIIIRIKPLSVAKRALLLLFAFLCLYAALVLIVNLGLPDRATYSGTISSEGIFAPELNAFAPLFTASRVDGAVFNLLELRGSPVVINFWATWCGPCAAEMPDLQAFYESRREDGIRILGVNLGERPEDIAAWVEHYGLTFDLILDPQGEIAALYRLRGQPCTYIVSSTGVITTIFYGPTTFSQLEAALSPTF